MITFSDAYIATFLDRYGLGRLKYWQILDSSTDNPTCIVNGDMLLRLDVRESTRYRFRKEAALFRRLRVETDLPVPEVLALDTSRRIFPYDTLLLERLPGQNGLLVWPQLDAVAHWQISYDMGQALALFHRLGCSAYGGFDHQTGKQGYAPDWQMYLLDRVAEILVDLWHCGKLPSTLLEAVESYVVRAYIPALPPPVLVHGDYGLHNVLLERSGASWHLSGLLDLEWTLAADSEFEFATGLLIEPDEANPLSSPFLQGYRHIRPLLDGWEQRSRIYRMIYHLNLCNVVCQSYDSNPAWLRYHYTMINDILEAGL